MLSVREVFKSYGTQSALNGVSLTLNAGNLVGLVGPNGAGKTTLAKVIVGLTEPDSGSIRINGLRPGKDRREIAELVGYAPQELAVYPRQTVAANLHMFGRLDGLTGRRLQSSVDQIAEALGLTLLMDRRSMQLSGGEQRRLHTAIALIKRPKLLLLDEPTAGADVDTRSNLLTLVRDLAASGSAVCYATHYLDEVERLDAEVLMIDKGRVIASGAAKQLIAAHGVTLVRLRFDGPPPKVDLHGVDVSIDGSTMEITGARFNGLTVDVLTHLAKDLERLRSVDVVSPSLESVYHTVVGSHYDAG